MQEKELVFSRDVIRARTRELGKRITHDFAGSPLVLVGVLNGAFVFLADLMREIDLDLEVDFVRVASYGSGDTAGSLRFIKDIETAIAGKSVLLVEDIIDTGRTLGALKEVLLSHRPGSLSVCALIDKRERREVEVQAEYIGFEVDQGFLVGYGLDFADQYRHYPEIYRLIR